MRESSCRDQWCVQCEEERVAAAVRRGELAVRGEGGAVLDRADHAEDGGAVAGLGGHVDDARDPRASNLPPRGGSCVPAHGRTGRGSPPPGVGCAHPRAGLPSSGGPPRLRAAHEAALGGERAARLPAVDRRAHRLLRAHHRGRRGGPAARRRRGPGHRARCGRAGPLGRRAVGARLDVDRVRGAHRRRRAAPHDGVSGRVRMGAVPAHPGGGSRDGGGRSLARDCGDGRRGGGHHRGLDERRTSPDPRSPSGRPGSRSVSTWGS